MFSIPVALHSPLALALALASASFSGRGISLKSSRLFVLPAFSFRAGFLGRGLATREFGHFALITFLSAG